MPPSTTKPTCYRKNLNSILPLPTYQRCGSSSTCCDEGDTCLENGICHFTHQLSGGTGYYIAACLDAEYQDPACMLRCGVNILPDIIYNTRSGNWSCCGVAKDLPPRPNCSAPIDESFLAPSPEELLARVPSSARSSVSSTLITLSLTSEATSSVSGTSIESIPTFTLISSTSTTSTNSLSTASSPNSTPLPSPNQNPSETTQPTLTTPATIGLGVGFSLLFLILASLLTLFLLRRRRRRKGQFDPATTANRIPTINSTLSNNSQGPLTGRNPFMPQMPSVSSLRPMASPQVADLGIRSGDVVEVRRRID